MPYPRWLLLVLLTTACGYRNDSDSEPPAAVEVPIVEAAIDADQELADVLPGEGVGVFVEYQSGGGWRVFTSCDTQVTGYVCEWDLIIQGLEGAVFDEVQAQDLGEEDFLNISSDELELLTLTSYNLDGISFSARAGAPIRLDAFLDGESAERYVYWVGGGGVHNGAPTNPLDLRPNVP